MALDQLRLRSVPPGTSHRWMRAWDKFGSQNKALRFAQE
jgi:hypothetical protein